MKKDELFNENGILIEDEYILLKKIDDMEYDNYKEVLYENSPIPRFFKDPEFMKSLWNELIKEDALVCTIIRKDDMCFCGYCGLHKWDVNIPELEIELSARYHRQGIGYHALRLLIEAISNKLKVDYFRSRVDADNIASQALMDKLGAIPNGVSNLLIHSEKAKQEMEQEYAYLIDERLTRLAEKFGVEPKKLISHALEYKIAAMKNS